MRFNKYTKAFTTGVLSAMEYRFDFFVGFMGTIFPILIQVFLWTAIYKNNENTIVYGYEFSQMISYVVIASVVNKVVNTGVENLINDDIHTGGLAKYLTKPVKYLPFRLFNILGQKFFSIITTIIFAAVTIIVLFFTISFKLNVINISLFIPALILGLVLNFMIFFLISMLAFWLTEVGSFFMTIQVIVMVASGGVFPISVLGEKFVFIMTHLPFIYTTYFPIQILSGASESSTILNGMIIQIFWIIILSIFASIIWKIGIKRYVAVGG